MTTSIARPDLACGSCGHAERHHGPRGCAGCAHPQRCLEYKARELSTAQRAALACLRNDAEMPLRDVAELTGYSQSYTHDVLYALLALGLVRVRRVQDKVERNVRWSLWRRA